MSIYDINKEQDCIKNSGGLCGENELHSQPYSVLEKIKTGFITEKIFEKVSLSSDSLFQRTVSLLQTSYLDSASKHGFQYSEVTLVKNDIFLNEYKNFYQQKKASNYTLEELSETYGFLLFETENQAKLVCQRGLCVGSSSIITLGDPSKGVYVSKHSDCLHPRPWYHGKSGYIVIFNLIKGRVKCVSENYTTNYTQPSFGYDCHVAADANKFSPKTSHFRAFKLSQYYLYELSGNTVTERPRQLCPYVIVAFNYREPKKMATSIHKSIHELAENVLVPPWKGKLIIGGYVLCDITLWSTYGTAVPTQLPQELDFKYVMKVSSLKKRLPQAAFKKENYLMQKVCCQDLCFSLYETELSNRQGEKIDELIEHIKNKQLAIIKCLDDRGFFILLTSSAFISELDIGGEQIDVIGLHLVHSSLSTEAKDSKVEDKPSLKLTPILPALNCALLEAKKSFPEEGIHPNTLVKRNFQELCKVHRIPPLPAAAQDGFRETTLCGSLTDGFDIAPPAEKCPLESLTLLQSYFSAPDSYVLDVSTALGLLQQPQCPISDGICDAEFSLVMTPDPEFLDSETQVRKEAGTEENSKDRLKAQNGTVDPLSPVSNLRVRPKRKASMLRVVPSKRMNLCCSFPKSTVLGAGSGSQSATTLKLEKGQCPLKRKRGAEVLTAQFVQTTQLDGKSQEAPISKDVPVSTNGKRARKQARSPTKTASKNKTTQKRSPHKQRGNAVKGKRNPRVRKQPQPAKGETASQLESEVSLDDPKDSVNTATQPENTTVDQKDLSEDSIINCDSQALNMLADLALRSAVPAAAPSTESRNLPFSELPQNDVSFSKESTLRGRSDHEYHRGIKSHKGGLIKPSSETMGNSGSDLTVSQEEDSLVSYSQAPAKVQSALTAKTSDLSDASQNTSVTVEHSYALLLAEHSKKYLQQRGVPGPAFSKNGTKGPEAGTPVGKVMPFRHQQNTSPLQKLSEGPLIKRKSRLMSSSLKDSSCSRTVFSCDDSLQVTFKCETEYSFSLDSKYTNNPLEKTVIRALHGPWNTDLPDNVEEVKLLLHIWVALFYSSQNKVIRSSRKVVEHSNPAKYVSINSTLESFEFSEIEEFPKMETCSADPLLETNETCKGCAADLSFPDCNCLHPYIKSPPVKGLQLCEQKEIFAREYHLDNSERQDFIYSYNSEVVGERAKQDSSDKLETSNFVLSGIGNTQVNGLPIPVEDKLFQQFDNTTVVSYNDNIAQAPFTATYNGSSSQSVVCQKSMYSTLENNDIFHANMQTHTGALQSHIHQDTPINECQPSLERTDDAGYVMINVEPVTPTLDKNAYLPVQTEVINRGDKLVTFNTELIKQASPAADLGHPISALEKSQAQSLGDISSLTMSDQKGINYLSASSVDNERFAKETYSVQTEVSLPVSPSRSGNVVGMQASSLVNSSNSPLVNDKVKYPPELLMQTQNHFSISPEVVEASQVEGASSSAFITLEKKYLLNCIPSRINISDDFLGLRRNDGSDLNNESIHFETFSSVFDTQQTSLSPNRDEVNLDLPGEDSDIDLTLTPSPPTSPREQMSSEAVEQVKDAPISNVELQDIGEEMAEPEEVTLMENRQVNSVYPAISEKPLENKERNIDKLQPVTLVLSKEICTLEIAEEVVTSDFHFDSLIEEVSPASNPDPPVSVEETRPVQTVTPCTLKLYGTKSEISNKFSQIGSGDLTLAEKENSVTGPTIAIVGQDNLTQIQEMHLSAEIPLVLTSHSGRKDRLTLPLPSEATEENNLSKQDEGLSFSEKVQHDDTKLNESASTFKYEDNLKSPEKLVKPGNPLQQISTENRHLVSELSESPFCPGKIIESKSLADTLMSATAPSGIVDMSLKQQTSPKSIKTNLPHSDLKIDSGSSSKVNLTNSDPVDGTDGTYLEIPKHGSSSDRTTLTCYTKPVSVEPGFRTQEISVVRMASLLNNETEAELHEGNTNLGVSSSQSKSTFIKSKQKICMLQDRSLSETKELLSGGLFLMYAGPYQKIADTTENISEEPSAFFVPECFNSLVCANSKEQKDRKCTSEEYRAEADSETQGTDMESRVNSDIYFEPLCGDHNQDTVGNCRNPKLDVEDSCSLNGSHSRRKGNAAKDGVDSFMSLNSNANGDWSYSDEIPELETSIPPRNRVTDSEKEDKWVPRYIQIRDLYGVPRTYPNFTVTKDLNNTSKNLHSPRRQRSSMTYCGLHNIWASTWQVTDDLTQNTLDLEYLRFTHKLKQIVRNEDSQDDYPTFSKGSPTQIMDGTLSFTQAPEAPLRHPTSRSRSPLLVTIVHSDDGEESQPWRGHSPSHLDSLPLPWEESSYSRNLTSSRRNRTASFHLNKLKHNSMLKESQNDISLILSEYAEFNKVMMNNSHIFHNKDLNDDSGETPSKEIAPSFLRQSVSVEDMITDLCAKLHVKLRSVVKEAYRNAFMFYFVETEDKSFFSRIKSILRKQGHMEIEPQHFCQALQKEEDTLIVIIRNEDIASHLHQIPSLLELKHQAGVVFAGIDCPEDMLEYTHQELFCAGGFVVSDDKILETLTLAQLKELVKILENLNENGRWKWLLHYRENKAIKAAARMDSVAHKKNLILKSCQNANIIELLHYHPCDSPSSTKTEILKCLLRLQIQHISARFAVFLTDRPPISREVFENNGILVTDVNHFIENIQKVASPFRSSYW
ncbi:protein TASOR 2 isoform X3 [Ochotona princeps]|uniref:protein TASOR 2 isoform X3 n=1 Tax=Ochotona princeps TaxID=9978 RepID=UPI0027149640|nr:protein TASOR 2 isoform X3 [Ochotona princeps]